MRHRNIGGGSGIITAATNPSSARTVANGWNFVPVKRRNMEIRIRTHGWHWPVITRRKTRKLRLTKPSPKPKEANIE
jgi:hypothetical protein